MENRMKKVQVTQIINPNRFYMLELTPDITKYFNRMDEYCANLQPEKNYRPKLKDVSSIFYIR